MPGNSGGYCGAAKDAPARKMSRIKVFMVKNVAEIDKSVVAKCKPVIQLLTKYGILVLFKFHRGMIAPVFTPNKSTEPRSLP